MVRNIAGRCHDCRSRIIAGVLLFLLSAVLLCALPVAGQLSFGEPSPPPAIEVNQTVYAASSSQLAEALGNSAVSTIILTDNVLISSNQWSRSGSIVLVPGRDVSIVGRANNVTGRVSLHFGGLEYLLLLNSSSTLRFRNIDLRGVASRVRARTHYNPNYVEAFNLWPSVGVDVNTDVSNQSVSASPGVWYNNCSVVFVVNSCRTDLQRFILPYQLLFNNSNVVVSGNNVTIVGIQTINTVPVEETPGGRQIGTMSLHYDGMLLTCANDQFAPQPKSVASQWWPWFILGMGLLAITGLTAGLWRRRRRRQRLAREDEEKAVPLAPVPMAQQPPPPQPPAQQPESSGGVEQALWRTRTEGSKEVLSELELGPLLGSGGYGKVYKARWKGVVIAVKRVEKRQRASQAASGNDLEALLSASVSHPNVVATYRVVTVSVDDLNPYSSSERGSSNTAGTGGTGNGTGGTGGDASQRQGASTVADPVGSTAPTPETQTPETQTGTPEGAIASVPVQTPPDARRSLDSGGLGSRGDGLGSGPPGSPDVATSTEGDSQQRDPSDPEWARPAPVVQTWLLLEFCDRGSLQEAITRRFQYPNAGAPPPNLLLNIYRCLLDIVSGLEYLHSVGILHGDLKSANVVCKSTQSDARGFMCKLADFGLSKVLNLGTHQTHVSTQTYGTVGYMPAETLAAGRLTRASDVYSLGILMWELYTGQVPFAGMTVGQIFYSVVVNKERPPVPDHCPASYRATMEACWQEDSAQRPEISQVSKDLQSQFQELRMRQPQQPPNIVRPSPLPGGARRPSPAGTAEHPSPVQGQAPAVQPRPLAPERPVVPAQPLFSAMAADTPVERQRLEILEKLRTEDSANGGGLATIREAAVRAAGGGGQ